MEKKETLWKSAEQSFVNAYDFAKEVVSEKCVLSSLELYRLLKLLNLWLSALETMYEHASDVEMAKDFQIYLDKIKIVKHELECKFL